MHYGAFVRTRNFSYSDLNPTGFSPRTGYFENFQSLYSDIYYYITIIYYYITFITSATCDEMYSSCQITNGNWNGQYYLQWSVLF
jgi:hypothetical protein